MKKIEIYDTTLRDGTQGEGIDFSPYDKLVIAKRLDEFGIPYIEGGWPGSNPRDVEFFRLAKEHKFQQAKLVAFTSTRRPCADCENDANLQALLSAETPAVAIFGKSWMPHVTEILNTTADENLRMIEETVAFFKRNGKEVIFDAEHYFDGFKSHPIYAIRTLLAALRGGADYLVLCDTKGGSLPYEIGIIIEETTSKLIESLGQRHFKLGIHAHNDCGLAVINSMEAVRAGVSMAQGTVNGYGERCGNANLITLIPVLQVKMGYDCVTAESLKHLTSLSRFVSETANLEPENNQPFTGKSAFAHKGGVHAHAVERNPKTYEHIPPAEVGNVRRILVSDLAGKGSVQSAADDLGIPLVIGEKNLAPEIVHKIKFLEQKGYQYDVAEASLAVLLKRLTDHQYTPLFTTQRFKTDEENNQGKVTVSATIKIKVGEKTEHEVADGDGQVHALDNALRKALIKSYPVLESTRLIDYKVRVINNGQTGAASNVRVLITSGNHKETWTTVGVSTSIIEASWQALVDSYSYNLLIK